MHKKISLQGDINYNFFKRKGTLGDVLFDFTADSWSTKWTTKIKLPAQIDFEITGRYKSSFQTIQGATSDQIFADMGIRKKMIKGKAVINVSV